MLKILNQNVKDPSSPASLAVQGGARAGWSSGRAEEGRWRCARGGAVQHGVVPWW